MDKFLGQLVHEAAKIGRKLFLSPAPGYVLEPKPEPAWEDSPLSPSELSRAKLLLAEKLDSHWEGR